MEKRKKSLIRLFALFFAVVMAISVTACGKTTSGNDGNDNKNSNTSKTVTWGGKEIDISKFVTITHLSLGDKPTNGQYEAVKAEWDKYLKDKLNCALEIEYVGWTDYLTKYNLLLASGENLDLINTASDWLEMCLMRKGELFWH